ncbi:MAG: patatin-like phospholipase family protein [Rhodospirillaceae bacterium]|nr:patatin-like phospholipase family protein [Rhodospirillaceae bacterium]
MELTSANFYRALSVIVLAASLAACAVPRRTEAPSLFTPWGALRQDSSQTVIFNAPDLPQNVVMADHTGDGEVTVLALSGGGSYGPFGAGVLAGWTAAGGRPVPDVVTGVSAGALLATYAFLGPSYDAAAYDIYAAITTQGVYERRDLLSVPFSSSLAKQGPLRALMEGMMTDAVLDQVAAERRQRGRRLLVASTDLDNGRVVVWDLSAIAASERPDRRHLYVDALMASSAIPGFFEPVMISPEPDAPDQRQQLHVDGSISTSIFMPSMVDAKLDLPLKVYAIVNSQMMEKRSDKPIKVTAVDISAEALEKLMRTVLQRSVYGMFISTAVAGGDFFVLGIPDDIKFNVPQYKFTPDLSKSLFDVGFELGQRNAWRNEPPRFDSLTTQVDLEQIRALRR